MTLTRRPSHLADVVTVRDALDRLFDERAFRPLWPWNGDREVVPPLDLYTTPEAVIAKVAVPGLRPEDIDISISGELVTVRGSYKEEKESTETGYLVKELERGSLTRSFKLPTAVHAEGATATYADGLLTVTMPKTEEVKPRHVKVELGR
ncbi:MAG TPA: Hsp20/alpha crystallin family protein [Candidatus Limnocylindrales bacterium]|nr:Hsp20/alpha crystallin family protein [Candidatus Limnocylindrales bacterium]